MSVRRILSDTSHMTIRTSRIGLLTIHASAPIVAGSVSDEGISFSVRIDRVETGNPLLDPELHALVHELTDGTLTYRGRRAGDGFDGDARAGEIVVPLELSASPDSDALRVAGTSSFTDVHVPLPGLGHIKHVEIDVDGRLHLAD